MVDMTSIIQQGGPAQPVYLVGTDGQPYGAGNTAPPAPAAATISTTTVTVANGASLSGAVDLAGAGLIRLQMPATWTAASITLQTSADGITYQDLYDAFGVEYTIVAVQAHNIVLSPADFIGMRYLKLRSGTSGAPVSQGGARVITLVIRAIA